MRPNRKSSRRLDSSLEADAFVDRIKESGAATPAQIRKLQAKLSELTEFRPKVGVFGKTGVGKSSLCNALFGRRIAKVSNVKACTRSPQEVLVALTDDGAGMTLVDVPGVGENEIRDDEYRQLYESLLPELDVVLWVLKADDRAYSVDQRFYKDVVLPTISDCGIPIVFVINQVDKIAPFREWDVDSHLPGKNQTANIQAKLADVRRIFKAGRRSPPAVAVSADEKYGLVDLVNVIVKSLPDEKKYGFAREVREEHISGKTEKSVKQGFWKTVKNVAYEVLVKTAPVIIERGLVWLAKRFPALAAVL